MAIHLSAASLLSVAVLAITSYESVVQWGYHDSSPVSGQLSTSMQGLWVSAAPQAPALVGRAAMLLDDTTGRTLFAWHADSLRYPASTVKMLTAIKQPNPLVPGLHLMWGG